MWGEAILLGFCCFSTNVCLVKEDANMLPIQMACNLGRVDVGKALAGWLPIRFAPQNTNSKIPATANQNRIHFGLIALP